MRARIPLDVDLEDKLVYGLTPMRLAYLIAGVVAAFGVWSSDWAPTLVRGCVAVLLCLGGAVAAWGRWRGRALDRWVVDIAVFVVKNHRVVWTAGRKRRPPPVTDVADPSKFEVDALQEVA